MDCKFKRSCECSAQLRFPVVYDAFIGHHVDMEAGSVKGEHSAKCRVKSLGWEAERVLKDSKEEESDSKDKKPAAQPTYKDIMLQMREYTEELVIDPINMAQLPMKIWNQVKHWADET